MNRKILVAAVAAAFAAPAAIAQSSVTVGGTINILFDNVRAGGNTGGDVAATDPLQRSLRSHTRVRDGAGSNIRFSVIEDLGGGNSAFVQVESAVIMNSDTRADNFGNNQGIGAGGNSTAIWGNRNSAIGIRSKTAGRFLIGVWDVHYHEHYSIDPGWIISNSAGSTLNLTQNYGSGFSVGAGNGTRYANTLRWDSPVWSGFSMSVAYARPRDTAPVNAAGVADVRDNKKNRVWNFAPRYESGGLTVQYSYLSDKDATTTATMSFAGTLITGAATSVWKVTSNRLGARYKFANGLGIGALWDSSKFNAESATAAAVQNIKRTVWAFPLTFETGNHLIYGTYGRARDWKGSIGGVDVGTLLSPAIGTQAAGAMNFGSDTGAKQYTLGYAYKLSQRTNVSLSYQTTRNEGLVRYDMFANTSGNTAVGADPKSWSVGLRHTF
jgi:predicted porin